MKSDFLSKASELSNGELLKRVAELARREHEATAVLIAHLAVFDERGLYLAEGCASLFIYLTEVLHYSEHAAYNRMEVARVVHRFPEILELLADGSVNLTNVRLVAPSLTRDNCKSLLEAARHKTKEQMRELLAHLHPQELVPMLIRRIAPSFADRLQQPELVQPADATIFRASLSHVPAAFVPLAPERYKVQFTASSETRAKLNQAQDLLRHQIPDGDLDKIIDRALTLLIEKVLKERCAVTNQPRSGHDAAGQSRHISAKVKRAVWERDDGQCAFVAQNGHRCTERAFLEFHHVVPFRAGGPATVENIQLRCRSHNGYEAEQYFGPASAEPEFKTVRKLGP